MTNIDNGKDKEKLQEERDQETEMQETVQEEETTSQATTSDAQDVGEEIETPEGAQEAIESLGQIFGEFKKQLSPIADNIKDMISATNAKLTAAQDIAAKSMDEAAESEEGLQSSNDDVEEKEAADDHGMTEIKESLEEGAEIINLAVERLKRGDVRRTINVKELIAKNFDNFVDTKLNKEEVVVEEDGDKVVNIDPEFMKEHGKELIPHLIGGFVQGLFGGIFGEAAFPGPMTETEEAAENEEAQATQEEATQEEAAHEDASEEVLEVEESDEADDEDSAEEARESKYRVKFDLGTIISNFLKQAEPINPPKTEEERESSEKAREALIRAGEVIQDTLNGEATLQDVVEALSEEEEAADQEVPVEEVAKDAPSQIEAKDEKHAKILEISRQFERASDEKDDE